MRPTGRREKGKNMTATDAVERGSLRLREAWKHRVLTEEGIEAIAKSLDESSASSLVESFEGSFAESSAPSSGEPPQAAARSSAESDATSEIRGDI